VAGKHVPVAEAGVNGAKVRKRAQQQTGGHQQHHRQRDLEHYQTAP
jgi:hypothetical protein